MSAIACKGTLRSVTEPEFAAKAVKKLFQELGVEALFIEPSSPWENVCIKSFNGKLASEWGNIYDTEGSAAVIEQWRMGYI